MTTIWAFIYQSLFAFHSARWPHNNVTTDPLTNANVQIFTSLDPTNFIWCVLIRVKKRGSNNHTKIVLNVLSLFNHLSHLGICFYGQVCFSPFWSCILLLSNMVSICCLDDPFNLRLLRVWIFLSSKEYCDFFSCSQLTLSVNLNFNYCFQALSGMSGVPHTLTSI